MRAFFKKLMKYHLRVNTGLLYNFLAKQNHVILFLKYIR
jgi:hypothetical protein